jgi:hypothetical protein
VIFPVREGRVVRILLCGLLAVAAVLTAAEAAERLRLEHQGLRLPGPPARLLPADLDGDGRVELLALVAYTEWEEIGIDRLEGLIQVVDVVPALFDRRQLHMFEADDEGRLREAVPPLPLPEGVTSVMPGPPGAPALALTARSVSAVRLVGRADERRLELEPLIDGVPVTAGADDLLPTLDLATDLDGDGTNDLVFPGADGAAFYLGTGDGVAVRPVQRLVLPTDELVTGAYAHRSFPLPEAGLYDGDATVDLLVRETGREPGAHLLSGRGEGRFGPARALEVPVPEVHREAREDSTRVYRPRVEFLGDVDGDRRLDVVTAIATDTGRSDIKQAKRPRSLYRFHALAADGTRFDAEPWHELEVAGYQAASLDDMGQAAFRDLDGDGRLDLVTLTVDVSAFQVARVLLTGTVKAKFAFNVYCQGDGGTFRRVRGLDLQNKIKIDLDDVSIRRIAHFAGDLDGDGRIDYVSMGGDRTVAVHRGGAGCTYPDEPDLVLELSRPIEDVRQVRVQDLDGDGADDIAVARLLDPEEEGVSGEVVLELFLSGGGS